MRFHHAYFADNKALSTALLSCARKRVREIEAFNLFQSTLLIAFTASKGIFDASPIEMSIAQVLERKSRLLKALMPKAGKAITKQRQNQYHLSKGWPNDASEL
jgi:hypothetical protein